MGELVDTIAETCDAALGRLRPGPVRSGVEGVRRRMDEPVRIAVAGRVSAGKSTLVNALLGLRVAPTAAGECTRLVTWFRYGDVDEARLHLRDGSTVPLPFTARRELPEQLDAGVDLADIERIDVTLYADYLRHCTLLDTPGLAGFSDGNRGPTEELLLGRSVEAVARTDALVYVMSEDVREDDRDVLSRFRSHANELQCSAATAIAVLTKIDKLDETPEGAAATGARISERFTRELGISVAAVVPVMGLLAEAADTGRIDEERARRLRALAHMPAEERARAFRSARRLLAHKGLPVPEPAVRDLLERIDILGVRVCVDAIARGMSGAHALTQILRMVSGIDRLRTLLFETFAVRGDALKASAALAILRRLQSQSKDPVAQSVLGEALHIGAERLQLVPETRRVRAMEVMEQIAASEIDLPGPLQEDVRWFATGRTLRDQVGLASSASTEDVVAAAVRAAGRWRRYGNDGRRRHAEEHAAHVMSVAYAALAREARDPVHR